MSALRGTCWAITDHAAGNQRQALALAGCLGLPVRHLVLEPRAPWSWLAPRCALGGRLALHPAQCALFDPPWPTVAIGCGRTAALFTRMLRRLSGGHCYTVQILDPRIAPAHWDCVIAPRHDGLYGANVLATLGSLHPVDAAWLAEGRAAFPAIGALPRPRIGVLLGGPRHGVALDAAYFETLISHLRTQRLREGGSVLVLASRRTPADWTRAFSSLGPALLWRGPADGANPYAGVLGWADELVVTPDSVNLLSEACAVGCPVRTRAPSTLPARLAAFQQALRAAGHLHDLDDPLPATPVPPLRETAAISAEVKARIAAHQGRRAAI
jgi:mitochondrial fission protein ELM1